MNPLSPRYVLLVDDHAVLQHALRSVLEPVLCGGEVVCARSGQEALAALRTGRRYDLLLLDLKLPDSDGLRLIPTLRREVPKLPIAVFSGQDAPIHRQLAREYGADGFLGKALPPETLLAGIRRLLDGYRYFDDENERRLASLDHRPRPNLSIKQQRVLACLMEGLSNKEIAQRLDLSERTVKMHLTSVYQVLGVSSRAQAILVGQELNIGMPAADDF